MRRFRRSATEDGRRPDISGGDRAVLFVLAHHGEHEGRTVLEATYLLSEWRFPMERSGRADGLLVDRSNRYLPANHAIVSPRSRPRPSSCSGWVATTRAPTTRRTPDRETPDLSWWWP